MKRLVISAIAALSITAAAHAEGITVMTPNAPVSKEQAVAYAAKLDAAVKRVCAKASTPIIGPNVYLYQECVKRPASTSRRRTRRVSTLHATRSRRPCSPRAKQAQSRV